MVKTNLLKNLIWLIPICLTIFGTIFLTDVSYVEPEITPKWHTFNLGSIVCYICITLAKSKAHLRIDVLLISVILFIGYILFLVLIARTYYNTTRVLNIISFLIFVITFKFISKEQRQVIDFIIITFCLLQACYGVSQYIGFTSSNSNYFAITGSFDNPAGFSASMIPGVVFCLSLRKKMSPFRLPLTISLLIIILSIFLSESRTGIICLSIVTYIYIQKEITNKKKYYLPFILALIILPLCIFWKKDSTSGRLFIWENTIEIIKEKPLLGNGAGAFMAKYMDKQSKYFLKHSDNDNVLLADNINHPLNEYLLFLTEFGLLGFLILLAPVYFLLLASKNRYTIYIISIAVFSCFSYPLRYPFIVLMISYCIANVTYPYWSVAAYFGKRLKIASVPIIAFFLYFIVKDIRFQYQWGTAAHRADYGITNTILERYSNLWNDGNRAPLFLYNYAMIMNRIGQYRISNHILVECSKELIDYDTKMAMADNYERIGDYKKAISCLISARYMCPNRFIPLYRLMIVHHNFGEHENATSYARMIIAKPIKIESNSVTQIRIAAQTYLESKTIIY